MDLRIPIKLYYDANGILYTKDYLNKVPFIFKLSNLTYSLTLVTPIDNINRSFQVNFEKGDATSVGPFALSNIGTETVGGQTWYAYSTLIEGTTLSVSQSNRNNILKISFYITDGNTAETVTLNSQPYVAKCQYSITTYQPQIQYTTLEELQRSIDLALATRSLKQDTVFHVATLPSIVVDDTQTSYNLGYVYVLTANTTNTYNGVTTNYYKGDTLLATSTGWLYLGRGIKDIDNVLSTLSNYIVNDVVTAIPLLPEVNASNNGKYLIVDNATSRIIATDLPIVDNLSSQLTTSALSANQGRVLKELVDTNTSDIALVNQKADNAVVVANNASTQASAVIDIATNANEKATQAANTANAANATANNISGIASQALSVAEGANTKANNAETVANNAMADIALKQNKTDNTLQTTSKNVVGAINELNSRQVVSNYSFQDYGAMIFDVLNSPIDTYKVGDNFLLIDNGSGSNYEPDRWCSRLAETKYETITPLANGQIGVGYYILATISGDKPDITNMVTTDTEQTITGAKDFTGGLSVNTINIATQADVETLNNTIVNDYSKIIQLDFNAVIQGGAIVGSLTSPYTFDINDNNRLFEVDLLLPVATLSGSLPNSTLVSLLDSGNKVVNIKTPLASGTTATFGDLKQICKYDSTGFRWLFFGSCTYINGETPTITLSLIPSVNAYTDVVLTLDNEKMLNAITSTDVSYGEYDVNTIATPIDGYGSNGYTQGYLYKYVNTGTTANPVYDWLEITLIPTKTSDLDNDSGFQNATQVNALIETYLTTNAYSGSSTNL